MRASQYYMIFPWDTKKEIDEMISLIKELDPDTIVISVATPFPGTEMHEMCQAEGLLPEEIDWTTFFYQSPTMMSLNKNFTREEFLQMIKETENFVDKHNKKKRREVLLSDPLYFTKRAIKAKYKPRDLWRVCRSYFLH